MRVLVAGELNPDLILLNAEDFPSPGREVVVTDSQLVLGSSSAICAVQLARLGHNVTFAAKVGADLWGDFSIAALRREGIDVSLVHQSAAFKTGLTVSITTPSDRALVTHPGAMGALQAEDVHHHIASGFQHLHASSYFLQHGLRTGLKDLFKFARAHGVSTSLDTGYDPAEAWSEELLDVLEEVDVFLPNEVEIQAITRCTNVLEALRKLDNGRTLTVAKLGAEGCMTLEGGVPVLVPSIPIQVVDTTGAGDSFNAGFLHGWWKQLPLRECMVLATVCGALATRGSGGTSTQGTEEEIETYVHARAGH